MNYQFISSEHVCFLAHSTCLAHFKARHTSYIVHNCVVSYIFEHFLLKVNNFISIFAKTVNNRNIKLDKFIIECSKDFAMENGE